MSLFRSKRSVPTPEPTVSHGSSNPMFQSASQRLSALRTVVWWTVSTLAIGAAIGTWVYGPYFRLTNVSVSGTVVVQSDSVKTWVERDIHRLRWLIIPQDHSVMLSTTSLAKRLHTAINRRLSVETVTANITDRHSIAITIVERQAVLVWSSGEQRATIDRHGVIIGPLAPQEATLYPLVEDQTKLPIPTDASIASPELVKGFTTLAELTTGIGLAVEKFILPEPRCVLDPINTNSNVNAENINSAEQISNTNFSVTNTTNTNSTINVPTNSRVPLTIGTCVNDLARLNASDIWVQVSKGPVIYFDRHQDLNQAVDAVRRALEDTKNRSARYIDARFPGRLYIQ